MLKLRGRPKAFNEDEALMAAMNYFWEHGYDGSTLDGLLHAMQIKKSSFYAAFKSKEALFSRALQLYRNTVLHFLSEQKAHLGAKGTLLWLIHSSVEELKEHGTIKGCLLVNSSKECYKKYPALSQQIHLEYAFFIERFVELIDEAKQEGHIKSMTDSTLLANLLLNALNGLFVTIQTGATEAMIVQILEHIEHYLE